MDLFDFLRITSVARWIDRLTLRTDEGPINT